MHKFIALTLYLCICTHNAVDSHLKIIPMFRFFHITFLPFPFIYSFNLFWGKKWFKVNLVFTFMDSFIYLFFVCLLTEYRCLTRHKLSKLNWCFSKLHFHQKKRIFKKRKHYFLKMLQLPRILSIVISYIFLLLILLDAV